MGSLAAFTLLTAGLDPLWTTASLLALLGTVTAVNRQTGRRHPAGRAVLHSDGTVQARDNRGERHGVLLGHAWVSHWLCVFTWRDNRGKAGQFLVMAKLNRPDDFRRLRVFLRLGAGSPVS
ncbi:MAG: hypothetical protein HKO85_12000 [Xanthomonadales bacterium]|nr:hypothetical protein [Gammaproteobacteria bacterium]MBT8049751.1 hypothetical protein [Gammaproteobacteria bacterium]NNJ79318.1 hypothetical protein [Xanthomonadales bacterium]NNL06001.1 hypothetical protein [Xanthomonadales bacterium]